MTDLDRKILAKACGLEWRERMLEHGVINIDRNPTFTTPDDWELVRVKVVVPNLDDFCWYLINNPEWMIEWFLTLSIEERNKLVHDFCVYMYKQGNKDFQWVKEFVDSSIAEEEKKSDEEIQREMDEADGRDLY